MARKKREDLQNVEQLEDKGLYKILHGYIPSKELEKYNSKKSFEYGYNKEFDIVVISKDGTVGEVYSINGLKIGLPSTPSSIFKRSSNRSEQYWEREEYPKQLARIKSIFQWNDMPSEFKSQWIPYIDNQFDRRDHGFWFMNNGDPTYITGTNYMYLQWTAIDVGHADFREANRILYIYWEACKADNRCFGMVYLKIRRSGFSFMADAEIVNTGTSVHNGRVGILSKTGPDAKKMFTDKVVPTFRNYPFFFKPIQDGMDNPRTEIAFRVPSTKITSKNFKTYNAEEDEEGLNTTIDWKNTADNSYDGEKLQLLVHDESGKWLKPDNILVNWRITKTCLRLGSRIIGKCMMGSTCNAKDRGGENFKKLYMDSDPKKRSENDQTKSGLYSFFVPMEWNMEGFIDRYGMPVMECPKDPVIGVDGSKISMGSIKYWENEADALKNDPDGLNEFYRQYPRTESHAFRDESKQSIFNLTKIYSQIDYNDTVHGSYLNTRGFFSWANGQKDTRVIWTPDPRGRFNVSWIPPQGLQNRVERRGDKFYPMNEHIGAFGCDSYDISGTVDGFGSNGALHGFCRYNLEDAPVNEFFLEYVARPQTAEIFFEEVLMACFFYGMPILAENNKPRLLYHFKNRGYRGFSMNRPDKPKSKLSVTELELGGIPNSSEDVRQSHASAIETYIERYVGYDSSGEYRNPAEMGNMPFNRTLEDWARFDISNRTKFDASISSGLAIMANQKHVYLPDKKQSKISVNFVRYNNTGLISEKL
jgi:hypothetical protein